MTVVYSVVRLHKGRGTQHASTDGRTPLCNAQRTIAEELPNSKLVQCARCKHVLTEGSLSMVDAQWAPTSLPQYAQKAEADAAARTQARQQLNDASQERKRQQNPELQKVEYKPGSERPQIIKDLKRRHEQERRHEQPQTYDEGTGEHVVITEPENLNPTQLRARIERESENQHAQRVKRAVSDDAQKAAQALKVATVELRLIPGIGSALDVNCPTCFTRAGIACSHNGALSMVHPARVDYWASKDKFMTREEQRELAEKFTNGYRTPQSTPEEPQQRPEGLADAYRELSRQNAAQEAEKTSLELVEALRLLQAGEAQRVAMYLARVEDMKSRIRDAAEREAAELKNLIDGLEEL